MKRALALLAVLAATTAGAAQFTITITNTATNNTYGWSSGLLTLQPLIAVGPSPTSGNMYWTYQYANSNCPAGVTTDNGNATLLATRWGLTLNTNAWVIPPLAANGGTYTLTFDAPAGSRLSYIAWVNSTSVFDDFVAMHPPGDLNTLSVPLFNAGVPVENIDFVITGYDTNSTSPTDGSGATCANECPATPSGAETGCYVAAGNASAGSSGSFPVPPTPPVRTFTASTSVGQSRLWWTNTGPHQGVVVARSTGSAVSWAPTNGVAYTAGQAVGGAAATGLITTVRQRNTPDGSTFTLNDGLNPATVFEFDTGNGVAAGRIRVSITTSNLTASQVGDAIVAAVNGVGATLRITASKSGNNVALVNDVPGTAGNQPITQTVGGSFAVSGMSGGAAPTATVVYVDNGSSAANKCSDSTATAGSRYFYKAFAHANSLQYASGQVPSSSGIFSETSSSAGTSPKWCYSVGFASLTQPVTKLGATVFTSNASGSVTANVTSPGTPTTDGNERWRPVQLGGTTQSRPLLVPTQIGELLITGDAAGQVTAINPATGAVVWKSAVLGSWVHGQPVAQLLAYVDGFPGGPAYRLAHPSRDLIFVATHNSGSTTNNKVYALSSLTGGTMWTYAPNNLDYISGGMAVDYEFNRLYVGAHNGLRILNSLTGAETGSLLAGEQLDYGVNLDFVSGKATSIYTVSLQGNAYGIPLANPVAPAFTSAIGATSNWIFPTGNGFIATMTSGEIRRYAVSGSVVTQLWSRAGAGIITGATINYPTSKIYAGSTDGTLRQIDFNDGGLDKTLVVNAIAPLGVGFPTLDTSVGRLHVGTMDGRICAFPIPLP